MRRWWRKRQAAYSEDRPAWLGRAVQLQAVSVDAAFIIHKSFYLAGDFTGGTPLTQPAFPTQESNRYVSLALTRDVQGYESELIGHYTEVLRRCEEHGVRANFAVTAVVDGGRLPAYLSSPSTVFPALMSQQDGRLFFDGDQGYVVEVFAYGSEMFLHDDDPDESEEFNMITFPRAPLRSRVKEAAMRLASLKPRLARALGPARWSW